MIIKFNFNKIYIIESLFSDEIKTGKNLYSDLIRWKTLEKNPLYSEFIEVNNAFDFEQVLKRINTDVKKGLHPFIHFEIHGSEQKDGLILNSRELVSWNKISEYTRQINITAKNLIISLATCYGAYFLHSIDINKVAPFSCCVSTIETITTKEAEQDFSLFFETILNTTNFNSAVEALNRSNNNPYKYYFFSSEEFLELILKKLETSDFNPKSIENRLWVNSLAKRLRILSPEYAQIRKKDVKEIVRKQLRDQGSILREDARKIFLTVA